MYCSECDEPVEPDALECAQCGTPTPVPPGARRRARAVASDDRTLAGPDDPADSLLDQPTPALPSAGSPADDRTLAGAPPLDAPTLAGGNDATLATPPVDGDVTLDGTAPAPAMPSDGPLQVGSAFGDRYEILQTLGVGGMGAVYKALDRELGVPVALKVILTENDDSALAAELNARFKRELLLARGVTHPNVVRIHDLGDLDGMKYFTMSYVDGEDLSSLLKRRRRLEVPEALELFGQIVDGLLAAHDAGIVHRDLKPANIMIDGHGQAMLMDFGIARSVSDEASSKASLAEFEEARSEEARLEQARAKVDLGKTMKGAIVGTLAYMAPEQFQGKTADQRADVYALGLILYDMLMGSRRARGATSAIDEVKHRLVEPPVSAHSVDPTVPKAVDDIIERALLPNPEERIQSTRELRAALDRLDADGNLKPRFTRTTLGLAAAVLLFLLAGMAGVFFLGRTTGSSEELEPRTVLVADFQNSTGDDVFDGVLEEAATVGLEGASFVNTFPRQRARQRAQAIRSGAEEVDSELAMLVAQSEGLSTVIEGAIEEKGRGFEVTMRARDVLSGEQIAEVSRRASSKDEVLGAVGEAVVRLRRRLGDTVDTDLALQEETFSAASLEAAQSYTRAQELMAAGAWAEAVPHYQEAIELDPEFGRAYAGLGASAFNLGRSDEADGYYKQALANTARMTEREKFRTRGAYYLRVGNWTGAIDELQSLVDQYPADEAGLSNLALAYFYARQFPEALERGRQAVEIYPGNVLSRANLALYGMYAGDFDTAREQARETLAQNPNYATAYVPLAMAALDRGDAATARAEYEKLAEIDGGARLAALGLADLALFEGRADAARRTLETYLESDAGIEGFAGAVIWSLLAQAAELQGTSSDARRFASRALELSRAPRILTAIGLLRARRGDRAGTMELAGELGTSLEPEPRSFAGLLEAELALTEGNHLSALELLREARIQADSWLVRHATGRAYLAAEAYAEAEAELDRSLQRRGEATALYLDDMPTFHVVPDVYRELGEARQGLGSPSAEQAFEKYRELRPSAD